MDIKKLKQTIKDEVENIAYDVSSRLDDLGDNIEDIVKSYAKEFEEITKKEKEIEKTETKAQIEFAKYLLSKQGYSEAHNAYFVSVRVIENELKDLEEEYERLLKHSWKAHALVYAYGERGRRRFTKKRRFHRWRKEST